MEEKIIKQNKTLIFLFVCAMQLFGCQSSMIKYKISDKYSGPGIVFIYNQYDYESKSNIVTIKDGLGRVDENAMKKRFAFESIERGINLEIIPIGDTEKVVDSVRCVFQLVKGSSNSNRYKKDLHTINFFVGTKVDFENWSKLNTNTLNYFDSISIDWYNYYISAIKN